MIAQVCGAVLAGGASSRMGRPKHALPMPDGRSMIEHVVEALQGVCDEVIIVGRDDVLPALRHVRDLRPASGPLAGIEALLMRDTAFLEVAPESAKGRVTVSDSTRGARQFIICPCDIPLVTAELLQRLLIETDAPVTVFHVAGRDSSETLPMRVSPPALDAVRICLDSDRRSVKALLDALKCEEVRIDERTAAQLTNVNSKADFEAIRSHSS